MMEFFKTIYTLNWGFSFLVFVSFLSLLLILKKILKNFNKNFEEKNLFIEITTSISNIPNSVLVFFPLVFSILELGIKFSERFVGLINSMTLFIFIYYIITSITTGINSYSVSLRAKKYSQYEKTVISYLSNIGQVSIWVVGIIFLLGNLGLDMNALITGLGIFGFGIAFSVRGLFKDVISSVVLLLGKPLQVGDSITIDKQSGVVNQIGIKDTILQKADGTTIIVPNGVITSEIFVNNKNIINIPLKFIVEISNGTYNSDISKILKQAFFSESMQTIYPKIYISSDEITEDYRRYVIELNLKDDLNLDEQTEFIITLIHLTLVDYKIKYKSIKKA